VKLDSKTAERLEQYARRKGVDKSKILREIIEQYLGLDKNSEALSELDKIVSEAKAKMDMVFNKWVKYCEDHAKEVVARHPQFKEIEIKEGCIKSARGLILTDLQDIAREFVVKIKSMNIDNEVKREYYKKIWGLIDQYLHY
jgi:predicted DNA-binding protein